MRSRRAGVRHKGSPRISAVLRRHQQTFVRLLASHVTHIVANCHRICQAPEAGIAVIERGPNFPGQRSHRRIWRAGLGDVIQ